MNRDGLAFRIKPKDLKRRDLGVENGSGWRSMRLAYRGLSWISHMISKWSISTILFSDDILSVDTTTSIYLRPTCHI